MTTDLIFDTETTGLVNHKTPDHTVQPYPVQLACILVQGNKIMSMASIIINPGVPVESAAAAIHGITQEVIETVGMPLKAATGLFLNFLNRADRIVAHNADFDIIVTEAMLYRTLADYDMDKYRSIPRVCTMQSTTDICKLPGRFGKYKWPKLDEAYRKLVDPTGFKGMHDALSDVMACWRLLRVLEDKGVILKRGKR
jgi:DNA polymerase-3 subunit epsilon